MFRKIISNIAFSPATSYRLSNYHRYLHRSLKLRRATFIISIILVVIYTLGLITVGPKSKLTYPSVYGSSVNTSPISECDQQNKQGACLVYRVNVRNLTSLSRDGAISINANPGDTLEYSFSATNPSDKTMRSVAISSRLTELLAFGDVLDISGGKLYESPQKYVSWDIDNLESGQKTTRTVLLKLKHSLSDMPLARHGKLAINFGNTSNVTLKQPWLRYQYSKLNGYFNINTTLTYLIIIGFLIISALLYGKNLLEIKQIILLEKHLGSKYQ